MAITRREFFQSTLYAPSLLLLVDGKLRLTSAQTASGSPVANYMLRYFIRSATAQQQTSDLIAYCRQNRIPHVILFNENHWDMGWNLPTIEEARNRVEVLRPVFRRLREAGLYVSINMMTTLGHADMGRDERKRFSWQFMVGDDGAESRAIPCPIDPQWKSYIRDLYGLFAQLEPDIIYIDDDFRYHNHNPVIWGCFCPLHLEAMTRRLGREFTREDLVHRILTAQPQPAPEREQWFRLCGDSMVEATQIMSEAVRRASPRTHMGLMCSDPNVHAAEGRRWLDMVEALSVGGTRPVLRPHYAAYDETVYRDVAAQTTSMRKLQPLLSKRMRFTPELENSPFTRFSKSWHLTRLQMALSFFLASSDLTLDLHSFVETRFDYDTGYDEMLRNSFDYFSTLAQYASEGTKERGVQILWDDRFPLHRNVAVDRMTALPVPRCWEGVLDLLGFATTFYPDELKLAGRSYLEERTEDELQALLKGKVLLDGDAATFLVARGFGERIGLKSCQPVEGANHERMIHEQFSGKFWNRDESVLYAEKYRLEPLEGAIIVSKMFGPEDSFSVPGLTLYANATGGRVGIIPLNGSRGDLYRPAFRGWKRQWVMRKALEWIHQGSLPLCVEDAPNVFAIRRDGDRMVAVGIANLTPDPIPRVNLRMAPAFQGKLRVEYVSSRGKGRLIDVQVAIEEGYWHLQMPISIEALELVCFRIVPA